MSDNYDYLSNRIKALELEMAQYRKNENPMGDMKKSVYDTNNDGVVENALNATNSIWSGISGKPLQYSRISRTGATGSPLISGTWTAIGFNNYVAHSAGYGPWGIGGLSASYAPEAGMYYVSGHFAIPNTAGGGQLRVASLRVDGGVYQASQSNPVSIQPNIYFSISAVFYMAQWSYVELCCLQDSGLTINTLTDGGGAYGNCSLETVYLGI